MSPIKRIALKVGIVLVLGFIPTCATFSVLPVATRLAAPIACPSGTDHTEVVTRWRGNPKGGSTLDWDLYCLTPEGHGTAPSGPRVILSLLGLWTGVVLVLALVLSVLARLGGAPKTGRQDHAA